jgi:endoglucanase
MVSATGAPDRPANCPVKSVVFNQLGFRPGHAKRAAVVLDAGGGAPQPFHVIDSLGGSRAQGQLTAAKRDEASGDLLAWANFSSLKTAGEYRLEICGAFSDTFLVGEDVYADALRLAMRSYYGQRCGCKVDLGGGYHHEACHMDGAFHASSGRSGKVQNSGGWHDAGDYGRYVVNSGISTATLLWAWELYPEALRKMKLDIPESGGKIPDHLAEVRWNLEWMLCLQDPKDGGVWHKQTSEHFCAFIMPERDTLTSFVIGTGSEPYKSTCATADLAAVAAIAARCYREFDAAFADRCLEAARKAWTWAMANPKVAFRNPRGVSTGEYGDGRCDDEILWASAELFRTTGEAQYDKAFAAALPEKMEVATPSWSSLAPFACWAYCMAEKAKPELRAQLIAATQDAARQRIARWNESGYGNTLRARDYVWGSNSVAGNDAVLLLLAHRFEANPAARDAAMANLHYLLGCNCFGVSWVTHVGRRPFQHPHHRPSGADGIDAPWPGLLSGGPNAGGGDPVANKMAKQPPMKMWVDNQGAYSMNEVAINWNAPLVFLLAAANGDVR